MKRLIELRAERNWSQMQLAINAGVSPMTIYKMEHGKPVARATVAKVLTVLGVTVEEVAGLVFSEPGRVNTAFVQGAHSRKRQTDVPY